MFKTFKEYVNEKLVLNEGNFTDFAPQRQIGFDYKRSALEKIIQANKNGKMPFDTQHSPGIFRKEFGLTDEEINFLKKYGIIQPSDMGNIINKSNFSNIYQQMTNKNPAL